MVELRERVFAWYYPFVAGLAENAGQRETRREVFGQARGHTLEIGAGNGYNLPHLSAAVSSVVASEPSGPMVGKLRRQLQNDPPRSARWAVVRAGAEELPFPADSFDTVTAAFVLCTVPDPARALLEIARVLRPGGAYLFFEHVRAPDGSPLGMLQDLVVVPHRFVAAGCSPNRRTEQLLRSSPLRIQHLAHGSQPRSSPTVRPTIRGHAICP